MWFRKYSQHGMNVKNEMFHKATINKEEYYHSMNELANAQFAFPQILIILLQMKGHREYNGLILLKFDNNI